MKIVYCLHGTFEPGGMERIVIAKANALARRGHSVIIVTTEQVGRNDFFPLERGVKRLDSDVQYRQNFTTNPLLKFVRRRRLKQRHKHFLAHLIESERPDVVISTFGNEVNFIPEIAGDALSIAEIHFAKTYRLQKQRKGIWKLIDHYLTLTDRRAAARYDHFVVLTKADAARWRGLRNLSIIPNFVSTTSNLISPVSEKRVIAVGRLDFQKNYDEMLEVWEQIHKKYPDWILEIVGEGPEQAHLHRLIDFKGLNCNVYLRGTTPPDGRIYSRASILLHTARYEGFGLVLLEAQRAGLPVVAYDCPCGPAEIIDHRKTGFLIPPGNRNAMVEALSQLIENQELRTQMGQAAQAAAARFAPESIITQWEQLFTSEGKHNRGAVAQG